jgi:D-sedoheptulose 7-phosphate isomerase
VNWDVIAADCLAVTHEALTRLREPVEQVAADLAACLREGGKILLCGNGGSAADAQHMAGELVNRFLLDREPYAAVALSTDTSVLTSIGNDFSFEHVFEKQVRALGRPGDALVGFSTSGSSANVCLAFEAAREQGLLRICLVGGTGGRLPALSDRCLRIASSTSTPRIQEGHHVLMHLLCERIEELLA